MEPNISNGPIYPSNRRQNLAPLSMLGDHQPYQTSFYSASHTLPPLQPQPSFFASSPNDHLRQSSQLPPESYIVPAGGQNSGSPGHYVAPYTSHAPNSYNGMHGAHAGAMQQPFQNPHVPAFQSSRSQPYQQQLPPVYPNARLTDLRPMPMNGLNQPYTSGPSYNQIPAIDTFSTNEPQPTHVVGSQGRRGILPSAAGRPPAISNGSSTGQKSNMPTKDDEGKYPCPHCCKTYLHAKHLKRHLLRHTGDRPYMCFLCKDTFSRSDILKRHFQKCSIRRGNPSGATHLSHPSAHVRRSQSGSGNVLSPDLATSEIKSSQQIEDLRTTSSQYNSTNRAEFQQQSYSDRELAPVQGVSRPGSARPAAGSFSIRDRSLTGPGPSNLNAAGYSYSQGSLTDGSLSASAEGTPISFKQEAPFAPVNLPKDDLVSHARPGSINHANSIDCTRSLQHITRSTNGHGGWPEGYQLSAQSGYSTPQYETSGSIGQPSIKTENGSFTNSPLMMSTDQSQQPAKLISHDLETTFDTTSDMNEDHLNNGLYGGPPSFAVGEPFDSYLPWNMDESLSNFLDDRTERLVAFCFPDANDQSESQMLRGWLAADNANHLMELFSNFQGHWPLLHMPTFRCMEAYDGLFLTMLCVGAVYSDRITVPQVRSVMQRVEWAVDRSTCMLSEDVGNYYDVEPGNSKPAFTERNVEEVLALAMLQILFTWHGDAHQRASSRQAFPKLARLARRFELLEPVPKSSPAYSTLHQPETVSDKDITSTWSWHAWVDQERRSRLMYIILLLDMAMVVFFNSSPQFDPLEVRLPLPADDEVWEARTEQDCAIALGLHGPKAQASRNVTGSRRIIQPAMRDAMKALLGPAVDFQPRATNAYSKFILVHGLHVKIWTAQRQLANDNAVLGLENGHFNSSTPISTNDWTIGLERSGHTSATGSGQLTPTDSSGGSEGQSPGNHQLLKATTNALQKWKKMWDGDMHLQYPASTPGLRRSGFCRDGVLIFWLAHGILRNNKASDWSTPPDTKFLLMFALLKQYRKAYTANALRIEDIGSICHMDESYGVGELSLDMKLLFTPLN